MLVLSPEAGAYEELGDAALPMHPYDIEQGAARAAHARSPMPDDERADARRVGSRELAAVPHAADWLRELVNHAR